MALSNEYAPEHLILNTADAQERAVQVRNAGSVFIGPWTPESLGDYCSGTNHVLPTYGWARSHGALGVGDFMRRMTFQQASREALARVGPTAETLAAVEGPGSPPHGGAVPARGGYRAGRRGRMNIEALARPEIVAMRPYSSARKEAPGEGVLLNANEAPWSLLAGSELGSPAEPVPGPAAARAGRAPGRTCTACRPTRCWSRAAVTRASTC